MVYPVLAAICLALGLGIVGCGKKGPTTTAGQPAAASATTGPASQVTTDEATVSGTVNANGQPSTTYYFQYGPTSAYGSTTRSQTISGDTNQNVTATLSNLDPETTYHYQVVVKTGDGTLVKGGDQIFETPASGGGGGGPTAGGAGTTGGTTGGQTTGGQTTGGQTTGPYTTVRPTTGPYTTVRPTTGPYTTVRPTGGYTTVRPPTGGYTTVQPTTGPPTTVQPTTGK